MFILGRHFPANGIIFKGIIPALDRNKPRRQRAFYGIGGTLIRASAAIRTRIKIQDMLPGKILKFFDAKRFELIQLVVFNAPLNRLDRTFFQLHEKYVGNRCDYMKMFSHGQKTQKEKENQIMKKKGSEMEILQR